MLDDDGKLRRRFYNKQVNARKEGLEFKLTLSQFKKLLRSAGITSSMCGIRGYHLARNNDSGPYAVGNCSFKHYLENLREKNISEKSRKASRDNLKKFNDAVRKGLATKVFGIDKLELSRRIIEGSRAYNDKRRLKAEARRLEVYEHLNKSYVGNNNSQFGTFWITNGSSNKKWHPRKGKMPRGFRKGRTV